MSIDNRPAPTHRAGVHLRHLGLPVRDRQASLRFYAEYFGFDPATAERIADVAVADAEIVDRAVREANAAHAEGRWRGLSPSAMTDVLLRILENQDTGVLFVEGLIDGPASGGRKELYVKNGKLLHVASSNASELLGEYLVRRRKLEREELDLALAVLPRYGGRMGDTLISMGLDSTLNLTDFSADVIHASGADDADVLALGGRFSHDQLRFANSQGDLVISVRGRHSQSVTIADWFDSPDNHISTITTSDGFSISDEGIDQLVQAMASFSPPGDGHSHLSHAEANALSKPLGGGLNQQTFHLFPKMREVDALMRANRKLHAIVYEAHPELAFARMNGGKPVLSKKRQPEGYAERRKLLAKHGFKTRVDRLPGAARDDILDAIAVCRTATLIAAGTATRLGPTDERDRHGLPMNIWF